MIQSRAMLATLSISQWTARKLDRQVTKEVETAHAAHDAGRFNKLLVNKSLLDPVAKLAGQIRDYHYSVTLPWADSGARLLPSKLFMAYTERMRRFKEEFNRCVTDLTNNYPAEVQAARNRLGTMYRPEDYPDINGVRQRFDIAVDFTPVPAADDFRVDVATEAQEELRASVTRAVAARQEAAVKATYERVREVVSKIAERLSEDKPVFKNSLIDNARDLCDVLNALNITNDPKLDEIEHAIRETLLVSPEMLRNSARHREETARAAFAVLAKLP